MPLTDPWIARDEEGFALLGVDAALLQVYRYTPPEPPPEEPEDPEDPEDPEEPEEPEDPEEPGPPPPVFEELPNVQFLGSSIQEGSDPGSAMFAYIFGGDYGPQSVAQALDISFDLPGTVDAGDRLVVFATRPDGGREAIFDGIATDFSFDLSGQSETVQIAAVGIARALWDTPIGGRYQRDASAPTDPERDVQTDIPARFNPEGLANCTPENGESYPRFLDEGMAGTPDYEGRRWDLAGAACYLVWHHNKDQPQVENPLTAELEDLLVAKVPAGEEDFDPSDPLTYEAKPIVIRDTPITGRDWPNVLYELIRDFGFGMRFRLSTTEDGKPLTTLDVFAQQGGPVKDLWLQPEGSDLDMGSTNFFAGSIGRDVTNVVNRWEVLGALERKEASFILYPGFPSASGDSASISTLDIYDRSHENFNSTEGRRNKYRLYVLDETGEGHYEPGEDEKLTTVPDLKEVFDPEDEGLMVVRRRKPIRELLTRDANGTPLRATLSISKDYYGDPGLWDGSGTWQECQGGWVLLQDRIGIWVSCEHPNDWKVGECKTAGAPYPMGVVKGVEDQAQVGTSNFVLRLTCVAETDVRLRGVAEPTERSPISRSITRTIDAGDRLRKETITNSSEFFVEGSEGETEIVVRDDTETAEYEAAAARNATELGVLEGDGITIPYLTTHYQVGDRIRSIQGRGLSLRTDKGTLINPDLPVVVAVQHDGVSQTTQLSLSDAGTARVNYERRTKRRGDGRI